ncbi:MAG: hypothetical protein WKF75_05820 [Singulisphaera sp.]
MRAPTRPSSTALFALVSSAGTDPEILVIEARETPDGPRWIYGRLWLKHRDKEVWSSIRSAENTFEHDAKQRFRFIRTGSSPRSSTTFPSRKRGDAMRSRRAFPLLLLVPALLGQAPTRQDDAGTSKGQDDAKTRRERLHRIYLGEAEGYAIFRDASRKEKVALKREPVYVWTNPVRGGEQDGEVFIWTCRGRAEVLGTFFSFPAIGPRGLHHELHSLSTTTLDVTRPGAHGWSPQGPGIHPAAIAGAQAPGRSAPQRLSQMRALTRDFAPRRRTTRDDAGSRLLPQPLYRYESTDPDVVDGVFAFVTSAGTDPSPAHWRPARTRARPRPSAVRAREVHRHESPRPAQGSGSLPVPLIPWDSTRSPGPYRIFGDRKIPAVEGPAEADDSRAGDTTTKASREPRAPRGTDRSRGPPSPSPSSRRRSAGRPWPRSLPSAGGEPGRAGRWSSAASRATTSIVRNTPRRSR